MSATNDAAKKDPILDYYALRNRILGKAVREYREYNGVTKSAIAELLRTSRPRIDKIESGESPLTVAELDVLSIEFGCGTELFFSGHNEEYFLAEEILAEAYATDRIQGVLGNPIVLEQPSNFVLSFWNFQISPDGRFICGMNDSDSALIPENEPDSEDQIYIWDANGTDFQQVLENEVPEMGFQSALFMPKKAAMVVSVFHRDRLNFNRIKVWDINEARFVRDFSVDQDFSPHPDNRRFPVDPPFFGGTGIVLTDISPNGQWAAGRTTNWDFLVLINLVTEKTYSLDLTHFMDYAWPLEERPIKFSVHKPNILYLSVRDKLYAFEFNESGINGDPLVELWVEGDALDMYETDDGRYLCAAGKNGAAMVYGRSDPSDITVNSQVLRRLKNKGNKDITNLAFVNDHCLLGIVEGRMPDLRSWALINLVTKKVLPLPGNELYRISLDEMEYLDENLGDDEVSERIEELEEEGGINTYALLSRDGRKLVVGVKNKITIYPLNHAPLINDDVFMSSEDTKTNIQFFEFGDF